ncbi:hypothetical protein AtDm6_0406 [Acetobacter tropicalis]|uniref:Uncharacterized protein n=1 Tax=Acetobacter tropicalis TaxID=104102 RepID=A0A094YXI9_9PROT|nr:hypothetical protein AtDm6_0406 [Acetobacter tropicalis]
MEATHHDGLPNFSRLYHQLVNIELVIVLCIRNRAFQGLFDLLGDTTLGERKSGNCLRRRLVADKTRNKVQLAGTNPNVARNGLRFSFRERARLFRLAHFSPASTSCRPRARGMYGWEKIRRTCARPYSPSPAQAGTSDHCKHRTSVQRTAEGSWNDVTRS